MAKKTSQSQLKKQIWRRLSADAGTLRLDGRFDEAPEDVFAAMAANNRRTQVVAALHELILDAFRSHESARRHENFKFLRRALRLADTVAAEELRSALKEILLEDNRSTWGANLSELKELAARALVALPKSRNDLRFWIDAAEQGETSLPYALHAAIDIDIYEGFRLFWRLYLRTDLRPDHPLVEWPSIIEDAEAKYSKASIASNLESAFYDERGDKDPAIYEGILRGRLGLSPYTRVHNRRLEDMGLDYQRIAAPSNLKVPAPNEDPLEQRALPKILDLQVKAGPFTYSELSRISGSNISNIPKSEFGRPVAGRLN